MNNTENTNLNGWERIQSGIRDTERLIGQKKYNMAMVKARQTLEYMVKSLCEKSNIPEGSFIDMIDALYEDGIISKTTCEHYHKIRIIGNKAVHEDDNSAYNANQAHHLLSQEVYTFASDQKERRKKQSAPRRQGGDSENRSRSAGARSGGSRSRSSSTNSRRRAYRSRPSFDLESILRPLLLLAIIIVLIFIIKMIHPKPEPEEESSTPAITTESVASTEEPATEPAPTEATEAAEPAVSIYQTTDILNVRPTPSTEQERIGVLNVGAKVEYVGDHDERWAIIKFNGENAYVVKEYLTPMTMTE